MILALPKVSRLAFITLTIGACFVAIVVPRWVFAQQVGTHDGYTTTRSAPNSDASPLQPIDSRYLPNLIQVHPRVYSGGQPEGEQAFQELADRGVKTIISVDSATPNLDLAGKHGIRYVHLPHGYDGISRDRANELAKAVVELEGPIYIHCHHGKHRSPAAAAVACIAAGLIEPEAGEKLLQLAGTNPHYRGLFDAVHRSSPLTSQALQSIQVQYREIAEVSSLAKSMLEIERVYEFLKRALSSQEPSETTTLPPRESVLAQAHLLREHFRELIRFENESERPSEYMRLLRESEESAVELSESLDPSKIIGESGASPRDWLARLGSRCNDCHQTYRDAPAAGLSEIGRLPGRQDLLNRQLRPSEFSRFSMNDRRPIQSHATFVSPLGDYLTQRVIESEKIPSARKRELSRIADYIRDRVNQQQPAKLTFICTHNSRRSHFGQVWSRIAAEYYGIEGVETFSGGTEATAFNPRAVAALRRCGLQITSKNADDKNPLYELTHSPTAAVQQCFSKVFTAPPNPTREFCAVMTCTQADEACPLVEGCELRIAIPYEDPKAGDGTDQETELYDERCRQICREMLYLMSQV